jgi:hypothetical protein
MASVIELTNTGVIYAQTFQRVKHKLMQAGPVS